MGKKFGMLYFLNKSVIKDYTLNIFSFSCLFVLFLFSYQYKHSLSFFKEYDPTLNLGVVVFIHLIYFVVCNRQNIIFSKNILVFSVFALWIVASYSWSEHSTYSFAKCVCFAFYAFPAFLTAALVVSVCSRRLSDFIVSFLAFYIMIFIITLISYFQNPSKLPTIFDTNYLVTGQTLGLGTVILGAKIFHKSTLTSKSILLIACLIIISLFLMLHLGGRGPLLSTLIVLGVLFMVHFKSSPKILFLGCVLSVIGIFMGFGLVKYFGHNHLPLSLQRIFSSDGAESLALRLEYYQSAWNCLQTNMIRGLGIGGWPAYHGLGDVEWHPHNMFLEIAAETGLIGIILFMCFLKLLIQKTQLLTKHIEPYSTILLSGTFFCFLNALKSGDINDNILFFAFAGLTFGLRQKGAQTNCTPRNS